MAKRVAETPEPQAGNEYRTEDEDKQRFTGGTVPEEGIIIIPSEMSTKTGSNGDFRVIKGTTKDGRAMDFVFSSAKLCAIFDKHWAELLNQEVLVSGRGEGFSRNYTVKLVQQKVV